MGRRCWRAFSAIVIVGIFAGGLAAAPAAQASCAVPTNEIEAENCLPGAPASDWDIQGAGDGSVQGYATDISVDQGETVRFKVESSVTYGLDIYRLGYYGGSGARKVGTALAAGGPQDQPSCGGDASTGLIDCGNWSQSAAWNVPANATSGIYIAVAVRNGAPVGHIAFIVRDDDGRSDLLFQTSDTTWQAYNRYGGNSLYAGSPAGRAYEVSYNRPFTTADYAVEDWLFNAEYPMVRWLERNGYDVSYFTGVDSDRRGEEIREHGAFLSVGHDEYWSGGQRAQVEAARDASVHLAFFSGNEVFWKTRWEDGHRTLVCYKETRADAKIDPLGTVWTGTWRDPRFSPPADGGRPENALTGTAFSVNSGTRTIQVPAADGKLRLWRGTSVANLGSGATALLAEDTLGYEWDADFDNGVRPAGLVRLSSTTADDVEVLQDYGSTYARGTATHHLTLHRDTNGAGQDALVFGAGTIQWSWGLDSTHELGSAPTSPAMQQATTNLFADMGAQPTSPQAGLQFATASTDTIAPTATINGPATFSVSAGVQRTIQGDAADAGGGRVGAVEVSVDGGSSWHPASGRESWSYTWTPSSGGSVTPLARAADDSANLAGADQSTPPPSGGNPGSGTQPSGSSGGAGTQGDKGSGPSTSPGLEIASGFAVGPERARMSRKGIVRLLVACPHGEQDCRVQLRLKRRGRLLAGKTVVVEHGDERRVALKLDRSTRRKLIRKRTLRATVVGISDGQKTRTSIRLLAPRRLP
jgi:hypothetical protein